MSVNWSIGKELKDLLENEWDTNSTDKPKIFVQNNQNNNKSRKKRIADQKEHLKIYEEGDREIDFYSDIAGNTMDIDTYAVIVYKSRKSKDRRDTIFNEVLKILNNNKTDFQKLGGWDNINIENTTINDNNIKHTSFNITVIFRIHSRNP